MSTEENTGTPTSSVNDKGSRKRKGRGQNQYDFNKIAKAKESGVPINDLGQPHGESSKPLSTSSGLIVTQLIPITYDSWLKVPEIMKNSVWETIKVRVSFLFFHSLLKSLKYQICNNFYSLCEH